MIEHVEYFPDPSEFNAWVNNPNGDIYKHLRKVGNDIQRMAKRQVGVDSGALRASIYVRVQRDPVSPYVEVGSDLSYAKVHHEGHRPHVIVPVKARLLRFTMRGRVVYARKVNHPGARANRYLTVPMTLAVTRN